MVHVKTKRRKPLQDGGKQNGTAKEPCSDVHMVSNRRGEFVMELRSGIAYALAEASITARMVNRLRQWAAREEDDKGAAHLAEEACDHLLKDQCLTIAEMLIVGAKGGGDA